MSPTRRRALATAVALTLFLMLSVVAPEPASAIKVVTYNLLNFPNDWATRVDDFQKVMDAIDPDVVIVQEMQSSSGVNTFLNNVMNATTPGEYAADTFLDGPNTDNACFYRVGVIQVLFRTRVYTDTRWTIDYWMKPVGYSSSDAEFHVLSTHLKAGSTSGDEATRLSECNTIRDYTNNFASGTHFMLGGDFNMYTSGEAGYQRLIADEADNDGRLKDPINKPGYWHDSYTLRMTHSQSSRTTAFGGGSTGGMDDRYDQILISYALDDDEGLSYIGGSHVVFGQDGFHLNQAINYGTNYAVGETLADALHEASDHVPVYLEIQVPAKVDAPDTLLFGSVIVGGTAEQTLTVSNAALAPAESLSYSLTAPSGFSAPTDTFKVGAGDDDYRTVSMNTGTSGYKSGDLTVSSNDLDHPTSSVALLGTVLAHASPSLSASGIDLVDTLDFGSASGGFPNQYFDVYNDGYGALQAVLEVYDAGIVGGDGRFSFVGGFAQADVGADPAEYEMTFDGSGAAADSLYTAVLTLSTRDDQDVPGAGNLDDLVLHLHAYVDTGTSVPDHVVSALSLSPGVPNPFTRETSLALALPEPAQVQLRVYDVSGRLVRILLSGEMPAGVHEVRWDGKDDTGRPTAAGIYFLTAEVGDWREARKLILLR